MRYGDIIFARLRKATKEEKEEICKVLRIPVTDDIFTISKEYRSAAGHSFMNIFRKDHELHYKEILIDVADKLKPGLWGTHYKIDDSVPEEVIEEKIMRYLSDRFKGKCEKEWKTRSPSDKNKKEDEYKKDLINAGASQDIINSVMTILASGTIGSLVVPRLALYFFPGFGASIIGSAVIGLLMSIPWLFSRLGGPAYYKTILATIYMIRIRKRLEGEALL